MDQRTEPIEQDITAIRGSMTEKMEQIEGRIRSSVEETGESLKRTVDLRYQIEQHPWTMFGGAVVLGYLAGSMGDAPQTLAYSAYGKSQSEGYQLPSGVTNGAPQAPTFFDEIKEQFSDELALVKTVAVSSAVAFLRDVIRDSLPGLAGELDRAHQGMGAPRAPAAPTRPDPMLRRSTSMGEQPVINHEGIPTTSPNI